MRNNNHIIEKAIIGGIRYELTEKEGKIYLVDVTNKCEVLTPHRVLKWALDTAKLDDWTTI